MGADEAVYLLVFMSRRLEAFDKAHDAGLGVGLDGKLGAGRCRGRGRRPRRRGSNATRPVSVFWPGELVDRFIREQMLLQRNLGARRRPHPRGGSDGCC